MPVVNVGGISLHLQCARRNGTREDQQSLCKRRLVEDRIVAYGCTSTLKTMIRVSSPCTAITQPVQWQLASVSITCAMLLAERCAPGDQAISREAAAPLFIVLTAEQVFDAVATSAGHCARSTGSRRRQAPAAGVCGEPIIVRSATSQKGMKCPNQFTPSIMHMMGKVASGCAPLVQRLKEPCQSSEGSRSLSSRPAWSTAGPVVARGRPARRGTGAAVTVALRCGSCYRASFDAGDSACASTESHCVHVWVEFFAEFGWHRWRSARLRPCVGRNDLRPACGTCMEARRATTVERAMLSFELAGPAIMSGA